VAALPDFPYHPDPLATGSVIESDTLCRACGEGRGYVYAGPVFAEEDLDEELCPWCIADGKAAAAFGATFADTGWGVPDDVPEAVTEQVAERTPGFTGWQDPHWLYHCGDAAAFLGPRGHAELVAQPDALTALRSQAEDGHELAGAEIEEHLAALSADGEPTAYLFRCRVCGVHLAYSDMA